MNAVEVKNLSLQIDKHQILQDVTVSFEQGQIHGLVGRNGSGKTMLMKCICGFVHPTAGTILVQNRQVGKDIDFPENMGIIIETPGFLPQYSGLRNLKLLAALNHRIGTEQIRSAMRNVGLDPDMKRKVRKYSLGMRQRLGLAQAIMENPAILILDEPFNGLDKEGVGEMALCTQLQGRFLFKIVRWEKTLTFRRIWELLLKRRDSFPSIADCGI